jgi:hypothetical protein
MCVCVGACVRVTKAQWGCLTQTFPVFVGFMSSHSLTIVTISALMLAESFDKFF